MSRIGNLTVIGLLLIILPVWCLAGTDHFEIEDFGLVSLGSVQSGYAISGSIVFCVSSADTNAKNPNFRDSAYPYRLTLAPQSGSELRLFHDGQVGSADSVPVVISHRDVLAGSGYEVLTAGFRESHFHDGQFRECEVQGRNSELRFEIDLQQSPVLQPGSYSAIFNLAGEGGESGSAQDDISFTVQLSIMGAGSLVRVSGLQDLVLGAYPGAGDLQMTEGFCVYASTSAYRISISGNQTESGLHYVAHDQSGERIPMTVQFADNALGVGGTEVTGTPLTGSGDSRSEDCGGADNAALTVSLIGADLRAASSGNYTETLTLLVEPE